MCTVIPWQKTNDETSNPSIRLHLYQRPVGNPLRSDGRLRRRRHRDVTRNDGDRQLHDVRHPRTTSEGCRHVDDVTCVAWQR